MNGLAFLTSDDFFIQPGQKGLILCHKIRDFSLILFYSPHCPVCQKILPSFKKLAGSIRGCHFGLVNVSTSKGCVEKSQQTITPLKYVPYIVLYFNGSPYMSYKGEVTTESIGQFIMDVTANIRKQIAIEPNKVKEEKGSIPGYTTGHPIKGNLKEMVTYLEFDEAYEKDKAERN